MKVRLLILLFFVSNNFLFAQQQEVLDSLLKQLPVESNDSVKVDLYNSIAWEYRNSELGKVHLYADSALVLAKQIQYHNGQVRSHFNVGNLYYIQGDYPQTLNYYLKALGILEQQGDKSGIANALMGIGNVHAAQQNIDEAIEYQEKALEIRKEINDSLGLAASYNNLGGIYIEQEEYMKALEYYLASMKIKQKKGRWQGLSSSYGNIGSIYQKLGNYTQALDYQEKALDIRKRLNNKKGMVMSYTDIGNIYMAQNKLDDALKQYKLALEYAYEVNYSIGVINALKAISSNYEKKGNYAASLDYYKKLIQAKDSIFNLDKAAQITELEKKFEVEKTQKELEIVKKDKQISELKLSEQDQKLKRRGLFIGLVVIALLFALGIAYSLYKRNQLRQKANKKLAEKNERISKQSDAINYKNQQITDSIEYAKTLQEAILPSGSILNKNFDDHFILYQPRDIVSGDFYWIHEDESTVYVAVVDCTGHGVPGAFVSMLSNNLLNEIIINKKVDSPGKVLMELNKGVKTVFSRNETNPNPNDGMDMALCFVDKASKKLTYAGAKNKLIVYTALHDTVEITANDYSIGGSTPVDYVYHDKEFQLNKRDTFYLYTDGYKDQFGGEKGKKIKYNKFLELLTDDSNVSMEKQKTRLIHFIKEWRGLYQQVDDICIMGIKV